MNTYKLYIFCAVIFSAIVYVQLQEQEDLDKYRKMSNLFRSLMEEMRANDNKTEALEVANEAHATTTDGHVTRFEMENKMESQLESFRVLLQALDTKLDKMNRGNAAEKAMRIENTKSAKLFHDHLQDMFETFNVTMKHHEEFIQEAVETLGANIKRNLDKTTALTEKMIGISNGLVKGIEKNGQSIENIATVIETTGNRAEEINRNGLNGNEINLALQKTATESSTRISRPNTATDGEKSGVWDKGSCTHTNFEMNPWWEVDLGINCYVNRVVITNRLDCCGERLHDITVTVRSDTCAIMECGRFQGPSSSGATVIIACDRTVYGRFLKIQIHSDQPEILTLCEVEVF